MGALPTDVELVCGRGRLADARGKVNLERNRGWEPRVDRPGQPQMPLSTEKHRRERRCTRRSQSLRSHTFGNYWST